MAFTWFDVVVLFGILQGSVAAVLLLMRRTVDTTNHKLLAAVLFTFSLLSCKIALHTLGLWNTAVFRYFPLAIDLLIQPLIYLYIASLVNPGFIFRRKSFFHFLPAAFMMLHALTVYAAVLPASSIAQKDVIAQAWLFNRVKFIEDDLSVISGIIYGWFAFKMVSNYRRWLYQSVSDSKYTTFAWLKNTAIATAILGVVLFVNIILDQVFHSRQFFHWQIFYVYLSGLIYFMAFRAYLPYQVASMHVDENIVVKSPAASKYSSEELKLVAGIIIQALQQDKLHLNSELTLNVLSSHIKLSPSLVSETINKLLTKSFRTMINDMRVDEVKLKLADPTLSHLSILGIALECGFNSEASFYRIFKAATGQSPKDYLAKANVANHIPVTDL